MSCVQRVYTSLPDFNSAHFEGFLKLNSTLNWLNGTRSDEKTRETLA